MHYQVRVDIRGERPVEGMPTSVALTMKRHLEEVAAKVRDRTIERLAIELSPLRFEAGGVALTYSVDHARRSVVVMSLERVAELAG